MHVMRYSLGHKLLCAVGIGAPPRKWFHLLLHYSCVHGVTHKRTEFWNSCCASQERINVVLSVVPTALHVFFQPLRSHLAYPGFNKQCGQCEQQDCWHYEQDQQYNLVVLLPLHIFAFTDELFLFIIFMNYEIMKDKPFLFHLEKYL